MTKHGTRNGHGGKRSGSGRKLGSRNLATIRKLASKEFELDTLSDGEFSALCAAASPVILEALISIAISKDPRVSGAAKVGASTAILAYAYGKPRQRPQAAPPGDADWKNAVEIIQPGDADFEPGEINLETQDSDNDKDIATRH